MPLSLLPPLFLSILLVGLFLHGFFARHRRPCNIVMAVLLAVCAIWIAV